MSTFTTDLTAALATHSVQVEEWATGGGCRALATADGRFMVTNGDAALPDGEDTLVCEYDAEDDEIAALEVVPSAVTADEIARLIAEWISAR